MTVIQTGATYNPSYLVTDTIINSSDAEIDAAIFAAGKTVQPGTIIHTAGYATVKERGLDGAWVSVIEEG